MDKKVAKWIVRGLAFTAFGLVVLPFLTSQSHSIFNTASQGGMQQVASAQPNNLYQLARSVTSTYNKYTGVKTTLTPSARIAQLTPAAQVVAPAKVVSVVAHAAPGVTVLEAAVPAPTTEGLQVNLQGLAMNFPASHIQTLLRAELSPAKVENIAWAIQMGSFKNQHNAIRLLMNLQSKGYKAFSILNKHGQTRVYIGPLSQKTTAIQMKEVLNKAINLQGFVIPLKQLG
jgi:cell division septation protein DedD